ncbi:MAG: DUF1634 domain-containing protein [Sphaerobacter sp.]|nr:DUF1634 domain-containing protein [Sphaerobacter sp.]
MTATEQDQGGCAAGRTPVARPPVDPQLMVRVARGLRLLTGVGVALLIVGTLIGLARDGHLPAETVAPAELPGHLRELRADAIVTLGFLALLVAPAYGLITLGLAFLRRGDRLYAALAGLVLVILGLSVAIALLTRGA